MIKVKTWLYSNSEKFTYYVVQPGYHTWQDMSIPTLYSGGKMIINYFLKSYQLSQYA